MPIVIHNALTQDGPCDNYQLVWNEQEKAHCNWCNKVLLSIEIPGCLSLYVGCWPYKNHMFNTCFVVLKWKLDSRVKPESCRMSMNKIPPWAIQYKCAVIGLSGTFHSQNSKTVPWGWKKDLEPTGYPFHTQQKYSTMLEWWKRLQTCLNGHFHHFALVTNTLANAVRTIFDHWVNGQKSFVRRSYLWPRL